MRQEVLLGVSDTRRTQYFMQAAKQAGLAPLFWEWGNWQEKIKESAQTGIVMKIDPPRWNSCDLIELDSLVRDYKKQLDELAYAADKYDIQFWNHPSAIEALLDKAKCKETLRSLRLPVTEPVTENAVQDTGQLLEAMQSRGVYQVFIKPVNGSGAAGVSAFRWQKGSGRMALYTCTLHQPGKGLVNTKRLRYFSDSSQIISFLDRLFEMECVIERWYAKDEYQGYSYDMRAVVQDGRMDYLLARLSKGPITNLQLNNRPLDMESLGLSSEVLDEMEEVCLKAMEPFPGLLGAGIDILLEKGSRKPRIIEMNGQGDLIYHDIFHKNKIYRRQAEYMKRMGEKYE